MNLRQGGNIYVKRLFTVGHKRVMDQVVLDWKTFVLFVCLFNLRHRGFSYCSRYFRSVARYFINQLSLLDSLNVLLSLISYYYI
jgi:hypothetical protein